MLVFITILTANSLQLVTNFYQTEKKVVIRAKIVFTSRSNKSVSKDKNLKHINKVTVHSLKNMKKILDMKLPMKEKMTMTKQDCHV